jgi:D-alanyl-D-alanine carboxypeptidase
MELPRLFPPGEGWSYHGSNYIVLRLLVEQATAMTLRDALRQRVLGPLGLVRTDLIEGPLLGDCARGYLPSDNPYSRAGRPRGRDRDRRPLPPCRRQDGLDRR